LNYGPWLVTQCELVVGRIKSQEHVKKERKL